MQLRIILQPRVCELSLQCALAHVALATSDMVQTWYMVATGSRSAQQLACPLGCREGGMSGCRIPSVMEAEGLNIVC